MRSSERDIWLALGWLMLIYHTIKTAARRLLSITVGNMDIRHLLILDLFFLFLLILAWGRGRRFFSEILSITIFFNLYWGWYKKR